MFSMTTNRLNAVRIMASKLGVVRSLNRFVDDAIYNSEGVEVKLNALGGTVGNLVVLLHEVIEELELLAI